MKAMLLYISIFSCLLLVTTQNAYSDFCCTSIEVSHELNEDCCLEVTVENPYCYDPEIFFQIDSSGTWVNKSIDTSGDSIIVFTYCPSPGESVINYQILIGKRYHRPEPHCNTDGFVEGVTKFSGSVPIDCCDECPDNYESWFQLKSKKSNNCPNNGCEITHTFDIPDSIDCYTSYKVVTDSSSTLMLPLTSDSLFNIDGCISAGTTFNAKVILFTANGDSCVIDKSIDCDEPRDSTDLQPPCVPDCFDTPFGPPDTKTFLISGCSGFCLVKVTYVWRSACDTYQDIQILKMELSQGCVGCSDAYIYHQALLGIMNFNVMNFDPDSIGCSTTWRVTQGGCWSDWFYYVVNPTMGIIDTVRVLEPCTLSECCLQAMTVCKNPGPPKTITITYDSTYIPPSIDCEDTWLEDPLTGWITQCLPKCDWLSDLEGTFPPPPPPPPLMGKKSIENEDESNGRIGIQLFQLDEFIQIQIKNDGMNTVKLELMDILGKVIVTSSQDISNGDNIIKLPTNKLTSGAYILTIVADDYLIKTEKFIIK